MKTINSKIGLFLFVLVIIILVPQISALSNESIQAKELIAQAEEDILYMQEKEIPVIRVNESYQEALQLYSVQIALETEDKEADYTLVIKKAHEVSTIRKTAVKAQDELKIFKESFEEVKKDTNLSGMKEEYNRIIISFEQERFEETVELIDQAYNTISEIQASQTAFNLFYSTTTRSIKNFFIKHWLDFLSILLVIIIFIVISWKTLMEIRLRIKLNYLILQKSTIKKLIKEIQFAYFKKKTLSSLEYNIRLKKFEELIREIDRKTMLLKEEIFKLSQRGKKKRIRKKRKFEIKIKKSKIRKRRRIKNKFKKKTQRINRKIKKITRKRKKSKK